MDQQMFCFQCEQTAGCAGCTGKKGVCGKSEKTARLQDELTGALIGLARATNGGTLHTDDTWKIFIEGLFTTVTNVNFHDDTIRELMGRVHEDKEKLAPMCSGCGAPCGKTGDYDLSRLWHADEDIRSLKSLILFWIRGMAAYAYHAMALGYTDEELEHIMLEEAKLWLDSGKIFGPETAQFERFNLACPRATVEQAFNQLKEALDKHQKWN